MALEQAANFSMITRLDGTNYVSWSTKCSLLLRREGLWDIVNNPPDVTAWDPADEEDAKKLAKFNRDNERALCIIGLTLGDQQLVHIRGEESAARCWTKLKRLYVRDSVGAHIYLTRKLFRQHLLKGGDMMAHLESMTRIFQELHEKELVFSELQQVYIILSSLDDSYDNFVSSLEVLSRDELTLAGITGRLLEESKRRQERDQLRVQQPKEEKMYSTAYFVKRCFACGAKGHIAKYCKNKKMPVRDNNRPKKGCNLAISSSTTDVNQDCWVVDSGASQSITRNRKCFVKMEKSNQHVKLANGWKVKVAGEGVARWSFSNEPLPMLYIPGLKFNLLSVKSLVQFGFTVTFKNDKCLIEKDGKVVTASLENDLFILRENPVLVAKSKSVYKNVKPHDECIHLLHRRLGHLNFRTLKKTVQLSEGIKLQACSKYLNCNACSQQKSRVTPANRVNGIKTTKPLEVVFIDLIGPKKPSIGGACYILSIVDHYSRYGFCYLMKTKSETFQHIKNWLRFVERKQKFKVKCLVTDNGTEFTNQRLEKFLQDAGIQHKRSAPYRPQHNSYIERRGQTLQAMIRTMLADSGLPENLWGEAVMCANHVLNNVVHSSTGEIPFTLWHGRKPNLSYLHTFGAPAWVHIPSSVRRKDQQRARKMFFVGYESNHRSFRFWAQGTTSVYCSASAKFLEHEGWDKLERADFRHDNTVSIEHHIPDESPEDIDTVESSIKVEEQEIGLGEDETETSETSPVLPRRSTRERHPPDRYKATVVCQVNIEPSSYDDIRLYPEKEQKAWKEAMSKEIKSLTDLDVYENVKLPPGEKLIGCRWVYKIKKGIDGTVTHKARLVAQGFSQTEKDFDEVFAPSLRASTLRTMLVWAAKNKYSINHIDVETAYLHAPLRHTIYMRKPLGVETQNQTDCWKLKKSLYGLKQSGFEWNQCIVKELNRIGFHEGIADKCLFKRESNGLVSFLLLFTDDIAIITKTDKEAIDIVHQLQTKFKIRNLGNIRHYLGLDISQTARGYKISQSSKISQMLKRYGMELCKPAKTPMAQGFNHEDIQSPNFSKEIYQSLIGSLSYISNWSRPDISFSVNQLARYNAEPTDRHWQAAKRILRYLKMTMHYALYLEPNQDLVLSAYADASFATDVTTRKSTSGIAIMLGNCLIGWKSIRQKHISLSTMEAEFSCLSLVCTDLIYYKQLMMDIGLKMDYPIVIHEDNQAAIKMATNLAVKTRSKHTDIRYLNVRQSIQSNMVKLEYCMSEDNIADNFTKAQGAVKHKACCESYGLRI